MKRPGLRLALADARRRGAAEGREEAAEVARKSLVRRTPVADVPQVTPAQWAAWRVARMACAIEERDVYGFGEETDDVHGA